MKPELLEIAKELGKFDCRLVELHIVVECANLSNTSIVHEDRRNYAKALEVFFKAETTLPKLNTNQEKLAQLLYLCDMHNRKLHSGNKDHKPLASQQALEIIKKFLPAEIAIPA